MLKELFRKDSGKFASCFCYWDGLWIVVCGGQFAGGTGTSGDPYQIKTPAQLDAVRNYCGAIYSETYFRLENDIDLTTFTSTTCTSTEGWTPIGTVSLDFRGKFNGNGKTIIGLWINRPTTNNIGLFGYVYYGTISNLGIEIGAKGVKGQDYVGSLIGQNSPNSVTECYVTGIGTVSGNGATGGLVGGTGGSITNCYTTVNVSAYSAGGIVGMANAAVSNCYASGSVSGTYTGGIVADAQNKIIQNCIAANSSVTGDPLWVGRIAGAGHGGVTGCYALNIMPVNGTVATGGTANNKDGLNKTLAELQTQSTYSGWIFTTGTNNWAIWAGNSFPYFQRQTAPVNVSETTTTFVKGTRNPSTAALTFYKQDGTIIAGTLNGTSPWTYTFTTSIDWSDAIYVLTGAAGARSYFEAKPIEQIFCGGSGTSSDPYLICDAEQLNAVRNLASDNTKYFKLKNDINLTAWLGVNSNVNGWEPIGTDTAPFNGHFDGNGFAVKGLWINRRGNYHVGLFGYMKDDNAYIKDLGVEIAQQGVTGFINVGGLIGTQYKGVISGCYVAGNVTGTQSGNNVVNVGGLAGNAYSGSITQSYACGTVTGGGNIVGGLVGMSDAYHAISNCYTNAVVTANSSAGGLVGQNVTYTSSQNLISNCYAAGTVSGYAAGGLVGHNAYGTIQNSVAANSSITGGYVYRIAAEGGTQTNCGHVLNPLNSSKRRYLSIFLS